MIPGDLLKEQFNGHAALRLRREGLYQFHAPLFHEDGDMVDIFLAEPANGAPTIRVSDEGMTLMRLSYEYDIDTESRRRVFERILKENRVSEDNGVLYCDAGPANLYPAILQFAQTVAKVSSMQFFRREVIRGMFYELLEEFILAQLARFNPEKQTFPLPGQDSYEVDWQFNLAGHKPIYLFGIKDRTKALLTTITCQAFAQRKLPFRSVVVHEDSESLARKDRTRLTNACDKQFTSLEEFQENAVEYFEREAA